LTRALERLRRKLTVENLWMYVIAVLAEKPTYPYDVRRRIEERFSFKPATITVYTVMYRMEREGLIAKRSDGTYEVTEKGLATLREAIVLLQDTARMLSSSIAEPP